MGNLKNATIAFLASLPSLLFFLFFLRHQHHHPPYPSSSPPPATTTTPNIWNWCYHHPFLLANLLFFFNVNILFWFIGLLQSNNWMIDLYRTVIPLLLVHYYASHPLAVRRRREIGGGGGADMGVERPADPQLLQEGEVAVGGEGGLEVY